MELSEESGSDNQEDILDDLWDDDNDDGGVGDEEDSTQQQGLKWAATESAVVFHLCSLVQKVKKKLKTKYPGANPSQINTLISGSLKLFELNGQTFTYTTVPNKLGGVRWFVECPKCRTKCLKLYLPRSLDREPLYLCRACHRLKPSSLLLGNTKKYRNVTKHLKRLEKVDQLLLKKRLTTREAEALLAEHEELEKLLADSVEYRLFMFRKEHGKA